MCRFWNWHEPVEGQLDWSGRGNLTLFLDAIAAAGLFANLRIGPYVCAEWDYGGIPTWLAYKEGMRFRTTNQPWQDAVQKWMGTVINQTRAYFADRGGPIVLAQVENELHGAPQSYVDWSGDMANAFDVNVPWLMCNGQSANNTINTCNTNDCTNFLAEHGQSGRILKDQPAMWTENEGWFTSWGEETYPVMRTQEDRHPWELAWAVARWFARGGSRTTHRAAHSRHHYAHAFMLTPLTHDVSSSLLRAVRHELLHGTRKASTDIHPLPPRILLASFSALCSTRPACDTDMSHFFFSPLPLAISGTAATITAAPEATV